MASANGGGALLAPSLAQVYTFADEVGRTLWLRKPGSLASHMVPAIHASVALP